MWTWRLMWVTFVDDVYVYWLTQWYWVCVLLWEQIIVSVALCCVLCVQNGGTALYYASRNGHDEVVRVLLAANATVNTHSKVLFIGCFQNKVYQSFSWRIDYVANRFFTGLYTKLNYCVALPDMKNLIKCVSIFLSNKYLTHNLY